MQAELEREQANLKEAAAFLETKSQGAKPTVGVICGSGLSGLVNALDDKLVVDYSEIPHFPQTTIAGHTGELVFGKVGNVSVVLMRGRFHSYEGHSMRTVTLPVKLMRHIGVEFLIVTNAAGGVNRNFKVGDLMIISDHIGFPLLAGKHPLVGLNDDTFGGARFPPMSDAYDVTLRQLIWETAKDMGMESFMQRFGTYVMVSGPTYETGAESQMVLNMGGDSVGMSTVPEVVVARHCGIRVLGLSLITNSVRLPGDEGPVASHEEVLDTVNMRGEQIQQLVRSVLSKLDKDSLSKIESRLTEEGTAADAQIKAASVSQRLQTLEAELAELKKLVSK
ncbi:S-methyl-5'-thioadenosine phosphorylase [Hondaea fermentalgiana]|uniref:purine-nucleoside phosphorylase n=1 Tax=Hondaea fermentalgiana TaxID=2315210 RepID=A0A2R5G3J7_9STRA|nr:S-methyl-5'-thioadenosine phosphorylase [Hondaea fermentalgiana]|eukprot:GBG25592.1 S-methyl-5'-thioadenosine phosphorylase [Hondaea fermentalgiana]